METSTLQESSQVVIFDLQDEQFAIPIEEVREIVKQTPITLIPQAPAYVSGMMNLRGNIVPVIDLRLRFGFPMKEPDKLTRIILVQVADQLVGLTVDSVREVTTLDRANLQPSGTAVTGLDQRYFDGVYALENGLVIRLNVSEILLGKPLLEVS